MLLKKLLRRCYYVDLWFNIITCRSVFRVTKKRSVPERLILMTEKIFWHKIITQNSSIPRGIKFASQIASLLNYKISLRTEPVFRCEPAFGKMSFSLGLPL